MLPTLRPRLGRWVLLDGLVALVALATELPGDWSQGAVVVGGELVLAGVIATRRIAPFPAAVAYGVAMTVQALASSDPPEDQLTLIAAVVLSYTFGTMRAWTPSLVGVVLVVLGNSVHESLESRDYWFVVGLALAGWVPGLAMRHRSEEVSGLRAQAAALQREQALREQAAAAAERNRLAQELHDVVSHSVSAMVVQAAAAEQVLDHDRAAAVRASGQVQQTGREAIAELHRLLGVLRPGDEPSALAPAPDLAAIRALVGEARRNGQDVQLDLAGEMQTVPAALQLAAYRIVQESLTNARKYAPRSAVRVLVRRQVGELEVEVVDSGGGSAAPSGGGWGLRGLQERAALFGGTVHATPTGSGFTVSARLPVPGSP